MLTFGYEGYLYRVGLGNWSTVTIPLDELIGYALLAVLALKGPRPCPQRPSLVRHLKQAIVGLTIFMAGVRIGVSGAFLDTVIEAGYGSTYKSVVIMLWALPLALLGCSIAAFVLVLLQQPDKKVAILGAITGALGWASAAISTYDFVTATGPEVSSTLSDVSFSIFVASLMALAGFVAQLASKPTAASDRLHSSK